MRYDGVDDETRIRSHVLCNVWFVDWRATQREKRGAGRGRHWELTIWGNNWRALLIILITPG